MTVLPNHIPLQLDSKSLSRRVYEILEEEIVAGRLLPGTKLGEEAIAERLGVSRSPVREAIIDLERIGFASRQGKRDRRVNVPDERFIRETFAVLKIVETSEAYFASQKADSEIHRACQRILADLHAALERGSEDEYASLSKQLHQVMKAPADNRQIRKLDVELHKYVAWLRALYYPKVEKFSFDTLQEHRTIFEFYLKQDLAGLLHSIGSHIDRHCDNLIESWRISMEKSENTLDEKLIDSI